MNKPELIGTAVTPSHRATVIEVYDGGLKAAVKFYCNVKRGERIECVNHPGASGAREMAPPFVIGLTGTVAYVAHPNGFYWAYTPSKEKE